MPTAPVTSGASRRATLTPVVVIVVVGVALAIAFFPSFFNAFVGYDDEGTFLSMIRSFLDRGDLYDRTFTIHGPFYFLVTSPIYWLTGAEPTLDNGRLIVLAFTTISAGLFAATVWRVTKSLPWTLLCQVGTFLILVTGNFGEPMHPGSLVVLLLAVLSLSLASYATANSTSAAVSTGAAVGALLMTKINIGLLAGGALVLAFAVGNRALRPKYQLGIVAVAAAGPFVVVLDNIGQPWAVALAVLVALAIVVLATISMTTDEVFVTKPTLVAATCGLVGAVGVAILFVLSTGTSLRGLFEGMITQPSRVPNALTIPPLHDIFDWAAIVLMIAGVVALLAVRRRRQPSRSATQFPWLHLALAIAGLALFGVGIARFGDFDTWLPLIVLLPALAIAVGARPDVQLALRMLVPLAVLQILHVYPVAGSQIAWGTVAMAAPCAIAIATGADGLSPWADAGRAARGAIVGVLCLIFMLAMQLWPPGLWKDYVGRPSLDLPGAQLLRVDETQRHQLRGITASLRKNCDALWFSPYGLGSYYVFTGIPAPTGLFHGFPPGLLNREQQQRVIRALSAAEGRDDRLCLLVDTGSPFAELPGPDHPLTKFLANFTEVEAKFDQYEIRVRG